MDTLVLLFVIIAVISNLTKNRKKKAEKKNTWRPGGQQAQARQPSPAQAQPHRPAAQQTTMGEDIFPWVTPEPPKSTAKPAKPAVKPTRPAEGQSAGGSLGGPFTEGRSTQGSMARQFHRRHGNGGRYCFCRGGRHGRQPGRAPAQAPGQPA